jgi:hypothetical protein
MRFSLSSPRLVIIVLPPDCVTVIQAPAYDHPRTLLSRLFHYFNEQWLFSTEEYVSRKEFGRRQFWRRSATLRPLFEPVTSQIHVYSITNTPTFSVYELKIRWGCITAQSLDTGSSSFLVSSCPLNARNEGRWLHFKTVSPGTQTSQLVVRKKWKNSEVKILYRNMFVYCFRLVQSTLVVHRTF